MNIQEYIASGILENYVLGLTTAEENHEVEQLALQHAEIKTELDAIEKALSEYADKHAVTPPSYLKEKVLAAVKNPSSNLRVIEQFPLKEERKFTFTTLLAAASVLLAVVLAGMYFSQRSDSKRELAKANSLIDSLVHANNLSKEQVAVLMNRQSRMVCLMGLAKTPAALAHVFWNDKNKQVFLEVNNLPMPVDSMQYQLWAIKDGKPLSAGMITLSPDTVMIQKMNEISDAQAFAITLEKAGGSETPKGEMYVMGKVAP